LTEQSRNGQLSLATFYKGWDNYQQLIVNAVTPLTAEQLAWSAPHERSVYTIIAHIIGARARWFNFALKIGGQKLAALTDWDRPDEPKRTAAELVQGLETSWQIIQENLNRWTPANLNDIYEDEDEGQIVQLSLQWIIWHLIEHDAFHGGELSFALGMQGLRGLDL
jgi:uncharacterized damage-inducible protein DinB